MKFTDLDLDEQVLEALEYMHYGECTPVQEKAIPPVLEGHDVIAVAQTGTGKTAAYLLPILSNLNRYRYPEDAINCVIMAPTRELAQQIDQQMQGFSYFVDASSVAVYGGGEGRDFEAQKRGLTQGADVVIATPGRLLSHLNLGYVDLSKVSYFVLDEADRMLDMGFYDDIMTIAKCLPDNCQKILYSATMPPKTQRLAEAIMYDPVIVKIAVSKPAEKIHQQACVCYEPQKVSMVIRVLRQFYGGDPDRFVPAERLADPTKRVVVFVSKKINVHTVARELRRKGFSVGEMLSDLDQSQREEVMNNFKSGRINVLVATDIVSRGIDISGIQLVINFDLPHDPEDYVHRIGRTARADADGEAVTFISVNNRLEMRRLATLEHFLGKQIERLPVPESLGGCEEPKVGAGRSSERGRGQERDKRRGGERRREGASRGSENSRSGERKERAEGPASADSPERPHRSRGSHHGRHRHGSAPSEGGAAEPQQPTENAPSA
jgi:superfamily II DNA/RNA helicase